MAYDDEEQLQALRRWWQANGRTVLITVAVALALIVGWQQWNAWQARQAVAASADYGAVLAALDEGEVEAARNRLKTLRESYPNSPHAALASFAVATTALADGEAQTAADVLSWVVETQSSTPMAPIARLRQAEALSALGDDESALRLLDQPIEGALQARYYELRGDLEYALGNREAAIEAYQQALRDMAGQRRALVEVKLIDLGGAPAS